MASHSLGQALSARTPVWSTTVRWTGRLTSRYVIKIVAERIKTLDHAQLCRARALRPFVDRADFLLDLHSMHEQSAPLALSSPLAKGVALARQVGAPAYIVSDAGHLQGTRLRDYAAFGDASCPKNALLVEAGQHWEAKAVQVSVDATVRFLLATQCLDAADIEPSWLQPVLKPQQVIDVTEAVIARSMDFRFTEDYRGLEVIAKAGSVIAYDGLHPIRTPYDDCVLVMPSLRQLRSGVAVVRFGQGERLEAGAT